MKDVRLDRVFAPRLLAGEKLLEVAVGTIRVPGEGVATMVLHLVGLGLAALLFHIHERYYLVGLTDRRLLLLGVRGSSDLTIVDEQDVDRDRIALANVSFSEMPGTIRLSTSLLTGVLEFRPLLLDANHARARTIGEALGCFESGGASSDSRWPTDVVPFGGLRRLRLALFLAVPLILGIAIWSAVGLSGGIGANCAGDGDCRGRMFCSRKIHPAGVCTTPCEGQADCPKKFTCSEKICVEEDPATVRRP